jgi:hypothetical protein
MAQQFTAPIYHWGDTDNSDSDEAPPPTALPLHGDVEREKARLKRERLTRWTVVSRRRNPASAPRPRARLPLARA